MADELERIPEDLRSDLSVAAVDLLLQENARLTGVVKGSQAAADEKCKWFLSRAEKAEALVADLQAKLAEKAKPKCPDCNAVGMGHCSDPLNCGGVYWPDHLYKAQEAEIEQLKSYQANYEHATQIERADAEAELQQEREDARRIIGLRQDRIGNNIHD